MNFRLDARETRGGDANLSYHVEQCFKFSQPGKRIKSRVKDLPFIICGSIWLMLAYGFPKNSAVVFGYDGSG